MSQTQTRTHITALANAMIPVADQDRAIDFYVNTLGFEKRADIPFGEGNRWVEVGPPEGDTNIALTEPHGDDWKPGRQTGIALWSSDLQADREYLEQQGVSCDETMGGAGDGDPVPAMFFFRDIDGNQLLLVQARAS